MSLATTTEQEELRATVRRFLGDRMPLPHVRELMATPSAHDPAVWTALTGLGVQGLGIPEKYDGAGFGCQELAHVFEECGRALLPAPLLATVGLAVPLLLASGDDDALARYLPGIASGQTVATVAWLAPGAGWDSSGTSLSVTDSAAGRRLSGSASLVLDGSVADLVLVVAGTGPTATVVAVEDSFTRTPLPTLDQTRPLARLDFDDTPCIPVGAVGDGGRLLSAALDVANLLLAAEMVGGAQACLDMAVGYAKVREQFGGPIGRFQAVKHKCAEMLVEIEGARAAAGYAAWAAAENPAELPVVATLAKASAAEAYFRAAGDNVQLHGGIGFTWEHDAHLYFKRAKASLMLFGDVGAYRRQLADRIGL
ncbi:MAG: acyl-CoA dehydrogenase family protein [Actinophytocola sp.]|uniref:acyl-CoA dehydrogenase family protein n=1 Tax=Actinophytocola sp. TaxID=1872138 RepID=UPI003C771DAF